MEKGKATERVRVQEDGGSGIGGQAERELGERVGAWRTGGEGGSHPHTHAHTHIHTYTHTHIHTYTHTHIHTYTHTHIHTYTHTHMQIGLRT